MKRIVYIFLLLTLPAGTFFAGFLVGHLSPFDIPGTRYSCFQIARFHHDHLMWKYGIYDGSNINIDNPRREINQRAIDLNHKLLEVCNENPTQLTSVSPHVFPPINPSIFIPN